MKGTAEEASTANELAESIEFQFSMGFGRRHVLIEPPGKSDRGIRTGHRGGANRIEVNRQRFEPFEKGIEGAAEPGRFVWGTRSR